MKCNQSRPGFELVSPCSFPTTITITPRAPPVTITPRAPPKKDDEDDSDNNCSLCTWNCSEKLEKKIGGIGNQKKNRDCPDYNIVKIGQNTEESSRNQRRLALTQTPVKDRHLTLVRNIRKEYDNNYNGNNLKNTDNEKWEKESAEGIELDNQVTLSAGAVGYTDCLFAER